MRSTSALRADFWESQINRIPELMRKGTINTLASIQLLNDELTNALAYVQCLKANLNSLIPVSSLPPETLASIFRHLLPDISLLLKSARGNPDEPKNTSSANVLVATSTRNIISVSHVCRLWRDISLGDPALWSVLWLQNKAWTTEMVARSKDAPITIISPWRTSMTPVRHPHEYHQFPDYLDLVLPYLSRTVSTRCMSLSITKPRSPKMEGFVEKTHNMLIMPARDLRVFQLFAEEGYNFDTEVLITSAVDELFGGHAPCLHELHVTGAFLHRHIWQNCSGVLSNLTSLTLLYGQSGIYETPKESIQLATVIRALKGMQKLEHLQLCLGYPFVTPDLRNEVPYFSPDPSWRLFDSHLVSLPRLSSLDLSGSAEQVRVLTRCIRMPLATRVSYDVQYHDKLLSNRDDDDAIQELVNNLVQSIQNIPTVDVAQIGFNSYFSYDLHLQGFRKPSKSGINKSIPNGISSCWDSALTAPTVNIKFFIKDYPHRSWAPPTSPSPSCHLARVARAFLSVLPMANITELRWTTESLRPFSHSRPCLDASCWAIVLTELAGVDTLVLNPDTGYDDILVALSSEPTLLPHLTAICLLGWVTSPIDAPSDDTLDEGNVIYGTQMRTVAKQLKSISSDRKILSLQFHKCQIADGILDEFEGIARELLVID